jgi:hypothetical protein
MGSQALPADIPPGYVKVDSPLAEKGRYTDGYGVRFYRGKAQKVGGWTKLIVTALVGIIRGMKAWNDLATQQFIAAGTTQKLYAISDRTYTPVDITPVDFTTGLADPSVGFGWGAGKWNEGTWGTPRSSSTFEKDPLFWSLAGFGKMLLAAHNDGPLYEWDPASPITGGTTTVGGSGDFMPGDFSADFFVLADGVVITTPDSAPPATIVANAPQMQGFFVTAERFVVAYGINNNLLQFQWCAQGDYKDWDITKISGTLGSPSRIRNVTRGRKIVAGSDIGGAMSLIWTDNAVYTHTFTGATYVFNTHLLGVDCGLLGPMAFVVVGSTAYWISSSGFFMSAGGGSVQKIPNSDDISQWFFENLRPKYSVKSHAWFNPRFTEVWFAFCSQTASEPDMCLVYNIEGQFWFTDVLTRTSATRFDGQDSRPILAGTDGYIYQHESGVNADGEALPWALQTALLELDNGQTSFGVDAYYPDMERQNGQIDMLLTAYDRTPKPTIETATNSFYPGEDQIDFRVAGRQIAMRMSSDDKDSDFRMGAPKFSITVSGRR